MAKYFHELTLEEMFEHHDHTYMMADDHRAYENGSKQAKIIVDKVKSEASSEGVTLVGEGVVTNEDNEELHPSATIYQWDAKVEKSDFFDDGETIIVKTIFWTPYKGIVSIDGGFQTIICIAFGTDQTTINQAVEIVENVN